jgi:mRNA interferase MazF
MTCSRGDIVLVPFPFADLPATKKRPVMVLTELDTYGDFLAVAITSRAHHAHVIGISGDDLVFGALPVASWVRVDRLVTLNGSLCLKSLATAREAFLTQVLDAVCKRAGYGK